MSKQQEVTASYVAVFQQLGGKLNGHALACTGRSGSVYVTTSDGPKPISIDKRTKKVSVHECEHEATDLVLDYLRALAEHAIKTIMSGGDPSDLLLPELTDFLYVYADEVEEVDVSDLTDAATVIANLMEKM